MWNVQRIYIKIEHRNLEIRKTRNDFSVQVRNFLLPLSLKVFRHKEREAQSFYSGFFICLPPTRVAPATMATGLAPASKRKPTVFSRGRSQLYSANFLQILPKSSALFRCVTSPALHNPVVVYSYAVSCRTQRRNEDERHSLLEKYIPLTLFERFVCERKLETEQNCNILPPTLMAISVSFPLSRVAQPEARGPSSLLDAGFLYHILSPTGLQTNWLPVFTELYNSSIAHSISLHNWPSGCVSSAVLGMGCLIVTERK